MNKLVPLLLLTIFLFSACGQSGNKEKNTGQSQNANPVTTSYVPEKNGKIVAKVNGVPIYANELKGRPVEDLVTDEIIYQEGLKEGIDKKYQARLLAFQKELVVGDMKKNILENTPPAEEFTDQELLDYYNKKKNILYTQVHVEEINFPKKDLGQEIINSDKKGENLKDIAATLSKSNANVTVTDLGFVRSLANFFKVKKVGELSGIISKNNGTYSIFKIVEVKIIPFEQVKRVLKYTVEARNKNLAFNEYAKKIAKENNMKVEIISESGKK